MLDHCTGVSKLQNTAVRSDRGTLHRETIMLNSTARYLERALGTRLKADKETHLPAQSHEQHG